MYQISLTYKKIKKYVIFLIVNVFFKKEDFVKIMLKYKKLP